jgi:hypothetical protein
VGRASQAQAEFEACTPACTPRVDSCLLPPILPRMPWLCVPRPACPALPARPPLPQVIVAERGPLVFVFNFSPVTDYEGLQVRPPASPACMIACIAPASLPPALRACQPACPATACAIPCRGTRYSLARRLHARSPCAPLPTPPLPALPCHWPPFPTHPHARVCHPPAHPPAPACRCLCLSLASTAWCSTPMPGTLGGAGGWATTWTTSQT